MPYEILRIASPSHGHLLRLKQTATKATVQLKPGPSPHNTHTRTRTPFQVQRGDYLPSIVVLADASLQGKQFVLLVALEKANEPRMWIEVNPQTHTQAAMVRLLLDASSFLPVVPQLNNQSPLPGAVHLKVAFYPRFEYKASRDEEREFIFIVDCSSSMKGDTLEDMKRAVVAGLDLLPKGTLPPPLPPRCIPRI